MATSIDSNTRLRRRELAAALNAAGYPATEKTLATLASRPGRHGGPPYQLFGRIPLYRWGDAIAWAEGKLGAIQRSTSDADSRQAA